MCPWLVPVVDDRLWQVATGVYCRRPDARVRVPGHATLDAVCTTDRFVDCAGYRRAAGLGPAGNPGPPQG